MSDERTDAIKLANRLLDVPWSDPDDDLRTLARQLLRRTEEVERLAERLAAAERAKDEMDAELGDIVEEICPWTPEEWQKDRVSVAVGNVIGVLEKRAEASESALAEARAALEGVAHMIPLGIKGFTGDDNQECVIRPTVGAAKRVAAALSRPAPAPPPAKAPRQLPERAYTPSQEGPVLAPPPAEAEVERAASAIEKALGLVGQPSFKRPMFIIAARAALAAAGSGGRDG
jgi:hypothetical protein